MVALMAEKKTVGSKVNLGVRVTVDEKDRLEAIADEISQRSYPATVTASELAALAIREYIERHEKKSAKK